ncbi:type II secretion system protein GspD [Armatimonas sp.]|uniref:type II secretion system protein GspD n=1 Tax=Armatimonas sp. TaxID=1872638 RepID=UPI0037536F47
MKHVTAALVLLAFSPSVQAQTPPAAASTIKLYQIKYATPKELSELMTKLLPEIQTLLGPQPKYVRDTLQGEDLGVAVSPTPRAAASTADTVATDVKDQFVRFLVLKGTPEKVAEALAILEQLDLPAPQVLIEAQILDINEGFSSALGISYDLAPGGKSTSLTVEKPLPERKGNDILFGRTTRSPITFNAAVDAAIQKNQARLLANPKLIVLYNQRARIFIGDEVSFLSGTQVSANGTVLQSQKVNVGVELNVTALANPDGTILLKVNPEVGSLTQIDTLANGISLPRISRRTVQTSVRLKDGETLVIGGLIGENEATALRKVPLLGDLPLLGQLFRRNARDKGRSELVIILKATIQKP